MKPCVFEHFKKKKIIYSFKPGFPDVVGTETKRNDWLQNPARSKGNFLPGKGGFGLRKT